MIEVSFQHWKYTFSEEDMHLGSCSNRENIAKSRLRSALLEATPVSQTNQPILFEEEQIICANEAFPEAAIADPLADIEVWNEWRSGVRIFPYPGKYVKLSINSQQPKTSSKSSIGVIGEIMAGLFGQAIVGHDVLVRLINRWPDFIFLPVNNRYAFLEAKAFTSQPSRCLDENFQVPKNLLGDCLLDVVRELAIDPFIKLWYSFTEIKEVQPSMKFSVNFLELSAPDERLVTMLSTPKPVIKGLAERAIQVAFLNLLEDLPDFISEKNRKRTTTESRLINESIKNIDVVLPTLSKLELSENDRNQIQESISEQVRNFKLPNPTIKEPSDKKLSVVPDKFWVFDEKTRYNNLTSELTESKVQFIRKVRGKQLYQIKLNQTQREQISQNWQANSNTANWPYKIIDECKLWRCGSSIFFICDGEPEILNKIKKEMKLD